MASAEQTAALMAIFKLVSGNTSAPFGSGKTILTNPQELSIEQYHCLKLREESREIHDKQCKFCIRARACNLPKIQVSFDDFDTIGSNNTAVSPEEKQCERLMRGGSEYHDGRCELCARGRVREQAE